MEKSYELREVGNKVVVRELKAPTYEMKTVLVADELVVEGLFVAGLPFFVLKKDGKYVLCWYKAQELNVVQGVEKYLVENDSIAYEHYGKWFLWHATGFSPLESEPLPL